MTVNSIQKFQERKSIHHKTGLENFYASGILLTLQLQLQRGTIIHESGMELGNKTI